MEFSYGRVPCVLHRLRQGVSMNWEEGDSFKLTRHGRKGVLLQMVGQSARGLHLTLTISPNVQLQQPSPVVQILKAYEDVFQERKGLPPHRAHDHSSPLIEGAQPV